MKKIVALTLLFTFNFTALNVQAMQKGSVSKQEIKRVESFDDFENAGNCGEPIIKFGILCTHGVQQLYKNQPEVVKVGSALVVVAAYYWWMLGIFMNNHSTLQG